MFDHGRSTHALSIYGLWWGAERSSGTNPLSDPFPFSSEGQPYNVTLGSSPTVSCRELAGAGPQWVRRLSKRQIEY